MTTTIVVDHLTKRFRGVLAVDDLSFTVDPGRVTGFLGPNGAGKTTTLRALLGLVSPTSGTATIGGLPYRELSDPIKRVGAQLEGSGAHPGRKAIDHLRLLATAGALPLSRAEEVLENVGLTDAAQRRVRGFSLGMRQRLGLAGALLGQPEILVLDEPANGLDPEGIHWLRSFLRGFADQGGTVLVSSHGLSEIAQLADEAIIVRSGRLVTHSSLADLIGASGGGTVHVRTPQAETLRTLLAAKDMHAELTAPDRLVVPGASSEMVGQAAADGGVVLYELTVERSNLEDVFLELTSPQGARP